MEKIWLKHYKKGIPREITPEYTTIVDLFAEACQKYKNNRALTCHNVNLTYQEVNEKVVQIAAGLSALGVVKGDRVAVVLPNSLQYPLTIFAILALGAVVVNVNPLYTVDEMSYILQDSEPRVVVCLDMFAAKLNVVSGKFGIEQIVITKFGDPYPLLKRKGIGFFLRYFAKVNPQLTYQPKNWRDLFNFTGSKALFPRISADDMAFLQYTGATTGRPKGAILSHKNIVSNVRQVNAIIDAQVSDWDKQISLSALPLYHIFSLHSNLFTPFFHGAESVMVPNARNIKSLVRLMNKTPFSIFNSLDSLYHKLLETPAFTKVAHPHYKYGICGGMPLRESVAAHWQKLTGVIPANCYGMTEACPCISMNYFDTPYNGSAGYPAPSTEIEIRDSENPTRSVMVGDVGVIAVRGPQLAVGYWKNAEQTAKDFSADGWLLTGDMGYFNEHCQLVISGRVSEMIIVSGFNVYPAEVERVLDALNEVREVAVVGLPNEATGEEVVAYMVLKDGHTIGAEKIIQHCRKLLSKYKVPHKIFFIEHLPKTLVGKVDKKALLAQVGN
jgi:long-chain acyl-CoA synthetase